jgi:hypothetical protein
VDPVPDPELGLAQDLAVGPGGEQFGDALDLVLDDGEQTLLDPVGFVALLRRQIEGETGHGAAFREETVKRSRGRIDDSRSTKFPTYIRDAHPRRSLVITLAYPVRAICCIINSGIRAGPGEVGRPTVNISCRRGPAFHPSAGCSVMPSKKSANLRI